MENKEAVCHPNHYGGENNVYEVIKIIDAYHLNFNLGNVIKYTLRAGHKDDIVQDLEKAKWYLQHEIDTINADRVCAEKGIKLLEEIVQKKAKSKTITDNFLGQDYEHCPVYIRHTEIDDLTSVWVHSSCCGCSMEKCPYKRKNLTITANEEEPNNDK